MSENTNADPNARELFIDELNDVQGGAGYDPVVHTMTLNEEPGYMNKSVRAPRTMPRVRKGAATSVVQGASFDGGATSLGGTTSVGSSSHGGAASTGSPGFGFMGLNDA